MLGVWMVDADSLARLHAAAREHLLSQGFDLEVLSDLGEFQRELGEIGKLENHPMLSPKQHDFATSDVFGLLIVDPQRDVIGGMASRRVMLGRDTLASHISSSYRRMYAQGDRDVVSNRIEATTLLTGNLAYMGELFLDKQWRGGRVSTAAVLHYAHCLAAMKWRHDWAYGFVRARGIHRLYEYGFHHLQISPQIWLETHDRRSADECLVYVSFQELCERASAFAARPELLPWRL